MCRIVALEAFEDVSMRNDAWPRDASGVGLLIEEPCSPRVVDVTVRVNDGADRRSVPVAQTGECVGRGFATPRVYEDQPVTGADGRYISKEIAGVDGNDLVVDRCGSPA